MGELPFFYPSIFLFSFPFLTNEVEINGETLMKDERKKGSRCLHHC
jgi:hypothetical protein